MGNRTIDVELEELPRIAEGLVHIGYDCGAMVMPVGAAGTGILAHLAMSAHGRSAAARAAGTSAKLATYSGTYANMARKVLGAYGGYWAADEMAKAGIMLRDGAEAVKFGARAFYGKELFSFERVKTIDPNSADAPKPDNNKKTPTSAHDASIYINKTGSEADEVDKTHQGKQYADRGAITVIPYRDKNTGQKRYMVVIPGTDSNNRNGDPHSWDNALRESGGKDGELTPQQKMIDQALKDAGAEPGSEVFLMGHSQGGMVAYNTANSTEFAKKYNVKGVYTEGSPLSGLPAKRRDFSVAYVEGKEPVPDSLGPRREGKGWTPDERDTVINTSNSGMDGHAAVEYEKALNSNPKGHKDLKQLKDFFGNGDYEAQQIGVYSASTMPDGTSDLANKVMQIGRYGEATITSIAEGANPHVAQTGTDFAGGEKLPDTQDPQYRDQEAGESSASTPNVRTDSQVEKFMPWEVLMGQPSFAESSQGATPSAPQGGLSWSDIVESSGVVGPGASATQMVEGVGRQLAENLGIASSEDANSAGAESFMDQLDSADASDGPHVMPYNPDTAPAEPHVMPYDPATDNGVPPLCRTSLILSSRTRRLPNRCRHPNRLQFPNRCRHPNQPRLRSQCRPLNRWRQLRRAGIRPRKLIRPPPPCPLQGNRLPNPPVRPSLGRQPESSPRPRWNRNTRPCRMTPPPITWEPPTCRITRPIPRCKNRCRCPPGWNPTTGTRPRRYPSLSRSHPRPLAAALTI